MKAAVPFLLIVFVVFFSFGLFSGQTGFYHDDWGFLGQLHRAHDFPERLRFFARTLSWTRPVTILLFPLFYAVGGLDPLIYNGLLFLFDILQGCFLFVFLDKLLGRRDLALTATALALMYPNHAASHLWFNATQTLAIAIMLASLVSFQKWLQSRGVAWLSAAMACYLISVLTYESAIFFPLMLWAGRGAQKSLAEAAKEVAPYGLALVLVLVWQRVGSPLFFPEPTFRPVTFSLGHFFYVFQRGFGCITYQTLRLCLRIAAPAWRDFGFGLSLLWGAFTLFLAFALSRRNKNSVEPPRQSLRIAYSAAAAGFIAANLPYALSSNYVPTYVGIMSRTSASGAVAGGVLLTALLASISNRLVRRAALALTIGAFTWTNWHTAMQWGLSWRLQQNILRAAAKQVEKLPDSSTLLLAGAPRYINTALNEVIVFDSSWDIGYALKLLTQRPDLKADVVSPRMQFQKDVIVHDAGTGAQYQQSYKDVYLYRYDRNSLEELRGPPRSPIQVRDF